MEIKAISLRIKDLRTENNLSQTEFANIFGVSQDTVSLWEKGKSLPNTEYIILICKHFEISADYLLGLIDF